MSITIQTPNITAGTDRERLQQIQSYLYQMAQQLQWAFDSIQTGSTGYTVSQKTSAGSDSGKENSGTAVRFAELKALIIKSADIVNAYYDEISKRLESQYVAQSVFGTYIEEASQEIQATSTAIESFYTNMQQILTDMENLEHSVIEVSANIKTGMLYYNDDGTPVYGLEIGQRTEIDGQETFHKYARFTAEKLSFYDSNGIEVAYVSDKKLYITHIEVTGTFTQGGFVDIILPGGGIITKWIGGSS